MGDWQEVWDENTGCYYYWNTQSYEVTWELPQYLATQVQGLQHYQHRWARPSGCCPVGCCPNPTLHSRSSSSAAPWQAPMAASWQLRSHSLRRRGPQAALAVGPASASGR